MTMKQKSKNEIGNQITEKKFSKNKKDTISQIIIIPAEMTNIPAGNKPWTISWIY